MKDDERLLFVLAVVVLAALVALSSEGLLSICFGGSLVSSSQRADPGVPEHAPE
jgi:hypothetical protein